MGLADIFSRTRVAIRAAAQRDTARDIGACDLLLVCNDSDRAYVFNGRRYSQLMDSIGDRLRREGLVCRTAARGFTLFGGAAYESPVSTNRALLGIVLGQRIRALARSSAAARAWRDAREARLWDGILQRSGARAVIAIQPDAGICRAANRRGVRIFDLQHGIIDTRYNDYYRALGHLQASDTPSGYLTWDEDSADTLRAVVRAPEGVRVIGNPWFARFAEAHPSDTLVKEAGALMPRVVEGRPTVLVTLQHGMRDLAPDYVRDGVMTDALTQAIESTRSRYNWLLRLHPSQLARRDSTDVEQQLAARFRDDDGIEWRSSSRAPMPLLLEIADAHVTHYSATTIEAAWAGVPTGLLDPHLKAGGKRAHLLAKERAIGIAVHLPLDAAAIVSFVESTRTLRASRLSRAHDREQLDAFVASMRSMTGMTLQEASAFR